MWISALPYSLKLTSLLSQYYVYTLLYSFGEQLTLSVMRIIAISLSLHSGSIAFLLPHLFVIEKCLLIHKMNELWFGGKRSKSILKCLTIGKKYVKIFSE